ncbi:hypothetical protein [Streptococcus catagoni]|uniref:hypothetical protein n=1 Tax=Streptococcus catagoni TaxID=2654874 RepID=UPI001409EFB3|nr:hypothetical protein [Streptococcus catagoni]
MDELQRRLEHFQWVTEQLSVSDKKYYLELDWYDKPTLITKEDAKKELEQVKLELNSKSIWRSLLRLFHR